VRVENLGADRRRLFQSSLLFTHRGTWSSTGCVACRQKGHC
jgi:hypothetical protein